MPNRKIGFNDQWVLLFMIPVTAFIIPIVFFGMRFQRMPYYTWQMYFVTLIITFCIWIGNRFIFIWARTKYSQFELIRKRLIIQSTVMFLFTIIVNNLLGYLFRDFCDYGSKEKIGRTLIDVLISSNSASIFCSLTVAAIYESRYFMNELKHSIEEKEMLKRESLQAQLNALKTQVNPHFLFNNLNTLCSIIPENPKQAVDFVQQLSKVYRHILEVRDEKSVPLKDEMEVLKAYAFLLKTRFGDNLEIEINVAEENLQKKIVPLSLQLLMENAIKHNIVSSDKPLRITVSTIDGNLVVSNNLQKKNQIVESTGIGLNNISNRYKLLTDKLIAISETNLNFTVSIPLIAN
jgi:hypothetical protein